jgi:hypothetical protein
MAASMSSIMALIASAMRRENSSPSLIPCPEVGKSIATLGWSLIRSLQGGQWQAYDGIHRTLR